MQAEEIKKALDAGIINQDQARALSDLSHIDDEAPKFARSFGDVFIGVGVVIMVLAAAAGSAGSPMARLTAMAFLVLVAEFLVKSKRLALPGIILNLSLISFAHGLGEQMAQPPLIATVFALLAAAGYFLRYRLPFALMAVVVLMAILCFQALHNMGAEAPVYFYSLAAMGVGVFALAMYFDGKDTLRQTRFADTGFWLHLAAAPMIAHGMMWSYFSNAGFGSFLPLVFYAVLFAVAIFVDRRAMVFSGLIYVVVTLIYNTLNLENFNVATLSNIVIAVGACAVMLGVYWRAVRRALYGGLSQSALARWVPPFD